MGLGIRGLGFWGLGQFRVWGRVQGLGIPLKQGHRGNIGIYEFRVDGLIVWDLGMSSR